MPYTDADFERMETDPAFRRQYVWRVGMNAIREAGRLRAKGKRSDADFHERFGRVVLDNIDAITR